MERRVGTEAVEADVEIRKIDENRWEIPRSGQMRVPGIVYADDGLMNGIRGDKCLDQVANVAHLPGIVKYSIAMPDIHWGYGFPIGGVAATDPEKGGVISPGGIGFDINCGVRLAATHLEFQDIQPRMKKLVAALFERIPCGVGSQGAIRKLSRNDMARVAVKGAEWPVEMGFGSDADLVNVEANGCVEGADPDRVSDRAVERGTRQLGTLGSGNHFLEVDVVDRIFDPNIAETLGLRKGQITVFIHSGSRGFGYQTCDDYLRMMQEAVKRYGIQLPDRQLACAPIDSKEGGAYLAAMNCAANYAWANRQTMMQLARSAFIDTLGISERDLGFRLVYDVAHNIAKFEEHVIDGRVRRLCVHRKGATRAFPPHHPQTPGSYKEVGQPVMIPGDMGRASFVCCGTQRAMEETFGSSAHGAGRVLSRSAAKKQAKGRSINRELEDQGIFVQSKGRQTLAEEMPEAYKDVEMVADVMHRAGITLKVARLKPVGVIKG